MKNQNVTRKQMDKIFDVLSEVIGGDTVTDNEQIIVNRKYVLAQIIEMYAGWKDRLDCLPDLIQVGAYNPIFLRIIQTDVRGME